jgi:hypothetical protein
MGKSDLILLCGHPSPYMCSHCAKCSTCCRCPGSAEGKVLPVLTSTLKLESQDRLRELRRAAADALSTRTSSVSGGGPTPS